MSRCCYDKNQLVLMFAIFPSCFLFCRRTKGTTDSYCLNYRNTKHFSVPFLFKCKRYSFFLLDFCFNPGNIAWCFTICRYATNHPPSSSSFKTPSSHPAIMACSAELRIPVFIFVARTNKATLRMEFWRTIFCKACWFCFLVSLALLLLIRPWQQCRCCWHCLPPPSRQPTPINFIMLLL